MQKYDQNNEQRISYMSQSLYNDEIKYSLIEKHTFSLDKSIDKFHHFILGKHTEVKFHLPIFKFFHPQTHLSGKIAHWLENIQEHRLNITNSNTIKGRYLAFHLDQHPKPSDYSEK
jgi:hypothetical protein